MNDTIIDRIVAIGFVLMTLVILGIGAAPAEDHGFKLLVDKTDVQKWIANLRWPDNRGALCCGKADLYEADLYERHTDGSYTAEITDGSAKLFPDGTQRKYLPNGTKVRVPPHKVNPPSDGNPTGHAIIFLGFHYAKGSEGVNPIISNIYCFVPLPEGS